MNELQRHFLEALLSTDRIKAQKTLDSQGGETSSLERVNTVIVPALEELGALWETGKASLSQVYMSGRICEQLVDDLLPPSSLSRIDRPRMAIATLDDYHFLGKRIVYSTLRASGFELEDYGRQTVEDLVTRLAEDKTRILLVSTLMLPSALQVSELKRGLAKAGLDKVRLVVGGAPFRLDRQLADEVGADASGTDASDAVEIVAKMMGEEG